MKKLLLLLITFSLGLSAYTQGVKISSTPGSPDPSAGLEVDFTNKGFLLPRMSSVQRNAIVNPAVGLMIYNTTTKCVESFFSMAGWKALQCDCMNAPNPNFTNTPAQPGVNGQVTFNPQSVGNFTYQWTFQSGNPATSTSANPVVTWSNAGTYTVTLIVTDAGGCKDTATAQITIATGITINTYNYLGQEYLLRGSQYSQLSDQATANCFCQHAGYTSAVSYVLNYLGTNSCYGYSSGCTFNNPWCSGFTQRHVITQVTCQ